MEYHLSLPVGAKGTRRVEHMLEDMGLREQVTVHYMESPENAFPYLDVLVSGEMACVLHFTNHEIEEQLVEILPQFASF